MAKIVKVEDVSRYDIGEYGRLLCQMPHFQMQEDELKAYIEKLIRRGYFYVIEDSGRVLGLIGFYANDTVNKIAYFSSMAVDPSIRGQGWSRKLLNLAFEDSRKAGMKEAHARVVKTNTFAMAIYRRRGCNVSECKEDPSRFNIVFPLNHPLLSVVCLAYNAAPYIRAALDGFLMQKTSFFFEILVHDDASTDGTADIIREYMDRHPDRIRAVFQTENQFSKGVEVSSTFLFPLIRGKYVAVCEGDDCWTDPLKLQKQVDWLDAHPESSICFHPVTVHFEDDSRPDSVYPTAKDRQSGFTFQQLLRHNFIQTNSVVFRWQLKGREDDVPHGIVPRDWFTNLLHAEKGPIGFIPDVMGVYRRHPGGVWWNASDAPDAFYLRNGFRHLAFYKAVKDRFGYDNPSALDLAANTMAAELRAGRNDRATAVVEAFPEYVRGAFERIVERAKLERELARARRRLRRMIWIAATVAAIALAALCLLIGSLS